MGFGSVVASWYTDWIYEYVAGTSYATVQVAGVAALMLERMPSLSPWQVREAMRMTGSQAKYPDNDYGWGIVDAKAAVEYWGPVIEHEPLGFTDSTTAPRTVTARVTARQGIVPGSVVLSWRNNSGAWQRSYLTDEGDGTFTGSIPPAIAGTTVEYYIEAVDMGGVGLTHPFAGQVEPHSYALGNDGEAPALKHVFLADQRQADWPPMVRARATDNVDVASVEMYYTLGSALEQGPFALDADGDQYELAFPLDPALLVPGSTVSYRLVATDGSSNANTMESGPFEFEIVTKFGRILIIDDLSENKSEQEPVQSSGDKEFRVALYHPGLVERCRLYDRHVDFQPGDRRQFQWIRRRRSFLRTEFLPGGP